MENPTTLQLETIEQEQQEEKQQEKQEIDWQATTCCLCGSASCGDLCEACLGFE